MLVIVGYVLIIGAIMGGYLGGGGHVGVLVQPFEFVIIIGAAGRSLRCRELDARHQGRA